MLFSPAFYIDRIKAREFGVSWEEYWEFLDDFADFSTVEGLSKLETYLRMRQREMESLTDTNESNISIQTEFNNSSYQNQVLNGSNNNNSTFINVTLDTSNQKSYNCTLSDASNDSLDGLSQHFQKLTLQSPVSPLGVILPTGSNHQNSANGQNSQQSQNPTSSTLFNPNGASSKSTESPPLLPLNGSHNSDNGASPENLNLSDTSEYRDSRANGSNDGTEWDSDDSCDTYYTAANSPPPQHEMVTPPSSPTFLPVYILG